MGHDPRCGLHRVPRLSSILLLLFLLETVVSSPLPAATVEVPRDQPTVQAAIDAASNGDLVLVAPGTHQGGAFVDGKSVRLASWFLTTGDTAYVGQTILNGVGVDVCRDRSGCKGGAVIEFGANAHGSAVIGLTISNGNDGVLSASMVDISSCRIVGNGDGVDYTSGGGGTFSNSLFANNRDDGIDLNGRVNVRILDNTIRDNRDDGVEFRLHVYTGPTLTTEIIGNRITGNGEDGIQLIDYPDVSNRVIRIERNLFSGNDDAAVGCMGDGKTVENLSGEAIPERVFLIHNTFMAERNGFVGGANVIALNNIFAGTQSSALRRVGGNSIASYNLFWNNGTDYEQSNVDLAHILRADPRLGADGASALDSPAIDAGTSSFQWKGETVLDLPPTAYNGSAPDLGPFESVPLSIECGGPTTIECPEAPSFPPPSASGACAPNPSLTFVDELTPGICPQAYSVTRTWTATDACGRNASCSQTIAVEDNTAPVISGVGGPQTIECPATPQFSDPTASDLCDPSPSLSFVDVGTPGTCPQDHSVTRTWTATDACGNRSQASQTITLGGVAAPPPPPNLAGNPSFEQDTGGWSPYLGATLVRVQGGLDGEYALEITGPQTSTSKFGVNDSPNWLLTIPAAGTRYRFTAWVRSVASLGASRLVVREYLNGVRVGLTNSADVPLSPQWQMLTVDHVTASGGSTVDFQVVDSPRIAGEVFLVDNISIRDVTRSVGVGTPALGPEEGTSPPSDPTPLRAAVHPSPFRSRGRLSFTTSRPGMLRVDVLDLTGRRVRRLLDAADAAAGTHHLALDGIADNGERLSPGMYFYRIDAPQGVTTGRFVFLR